MTKAHSSLTNQRKYQTINIFEKFVYNNTSKFIRLLSHICTSKIIPKELPHFAFKLKLYSLCNFPHMKINFTLNEKLAANEKERRANIIIHKLNSLKLNELWNCENSSTPMTNAIIFPKKLFRVNFHFVTCLMIVLPKLIVQLCLKF